MAERTDSNHQYEAMFLLGPQAATEPEAAINLCRGIIERHGGKIMVIKKWDERKLAYPIGGQKRGTYVLSYFKGPGSAVVPIERDVSLSEEVLRVLVSRADHLNKDEMEAAQPQPPQPREERPSWDRPDFNRPMREDRGPREEQPREVRPPHEEAPARPPRKRRDAAEEPAPPA
jgi:small subunit ribosomal protein S6